MKLSTKDHKLVGQNEQVVKITKHDVNLRKNSTLYFQVGLILTLLATYALFEMEFQTKPVVVEEGYMVDDNHPYVNYVPEVIPEPVKEEVIQPVRKPLLAINIAQVPDDTQITETTKEIITEPLTTSAPISPTKTPTQPAKKTKDIFDINGVEQAPIYPGCEKFFTNQERKKCMSKKIAKLVGRKFNQDLAADLGLSGKQRISVQFKIDKLGNVTEIKARAPHNRLEKEAVKVINKIPQMTPGKQRDKSVSVIYTLPIVLQVQ